MNRARIFICFLAIVLTGCSSCSVYNKTPSFFKLAEINNLGKKKDTSDVDSVAGISGLVLYKINSTSLPSNSSAACDKRNEFYIAISEEFEKHHLSELHALDIDWTTGEVTKSKCTNPSVPMQLDGHLFKGEGILAQNTDGTLWVFSENSTPYQRLTNFLKKLLSATTQDWDINSFDRTRKSRDRLIKVRPATGEIVQDFQLPEYLHWDGVYDWEASQCRGTRNLQGLHGGGMTPDRHVAALMTQTSLYQDSNLATRSTPASVRIFVYAVKQNDLHPLHQLRYDTELKTISSSVRGEQHFVGVFGMIPISETEFIVAEHEVYVCCLSFVNCGNVFSREVVLYYHYCRQVSFIERHPAKIDIFRTPLLPCKFSLII